MRTALGELGDLEALQQVVEVTGLSLIEAGCAAGDTARRLAERGARVLAVEPDPVQKPHPPLWHAAGRPESLAYTAREGYNLFLDQFATNKVIGERLAIYKKALADCGREYDPMGVGVARALLIVDNAEEREAAIETRARAREFMNAFGTSADGKQKSSMVSDPNLRLATEQGALLGNPDQIIEQLHALQADGIEYVLLSGTNREGIRRFARDILPAFS